MAGEELEIRSELAKRVEGVFVEEAEIPLRHRLHLLRKHVWQIPRTDFRSGGGEKWKRSSRSAAVPRRWLSSTRARPGISQTRYKAGRAATVRRVVLEQAVRNPRRRAKRSRHCGNSPSAVFEIEAVDADVGPCHAPGDSRRHGCRACRNYPFPQGRGGRGQSAHGYGLRRCRRTPVP